MAKEGKITYVNQICLFGSQVFMKHTYPSIAYVEMPNEFSVIGSDYISEIIFDIMGSQGEAIIDNCKIGEIHGCLIKIDRLERDGFPKEEQFCNGDDLDDAFWAMDEGRFGQNEKSKNIFFIDRIFVNKNLRHKNIASISLLMLPQVLDEQFNAAVGYIVTKPSPILDKPKIQVAEIEIYRSLCNKFWTQLGFADTEGYKYYNTTNDFVEENLERLSKYGQDEHCVEINDSYNCICDVKVLENAREIHVMEYSDAESVNEEEFAILQHQLIKELQLSEPVEEYKWIFYSYPGIVREYVSSNFVRSSVFDDAFYVKMLDYYGSFIGTK